MINKVLIIGVLDQVLLTSPNMLLDFETDRASDYTALLHSMPEPIIIEPAVDSSYEDQQRRWMAKQKRKSSRPAWRR